MNGASSQNGMLEIGGMPLPRLADRAGQTPFFAYDRRMLTDRVALLRRTLPSEIQLHYSVKANPMPALVQHMASLVDGFDVASAGEMRLALDAGMAAERVSMAGPGKSDQDLRSTIASGATVTLESATQLHAVTALSCQMGLRARVALRINPNFQPHGSGQRMAGGPRQFGVDAEQAPDLIRDIAARDLQFVGFHVFWGSQCLQAQTVIAAQRQVAHLVAELATQVASPIEFVNMGGGFGIPYFENERPLDIDSVAAAMGDWLPALTNKLPGARLVLEFGRYLVGEAGFYVCRIIDRKASGGEVFLITDGGLHHQLAASGNFGQVIRRNYPVVVGNRMDQLAHECCNVVGCLCTPLDRQADKVMLPRAAIGDFIVVGQSGAYGRSASPTAFLSHPAPVEILV